VRDEVAAEPTAAFRGEAKCAKLQSVPDSPDLEPDPHVATGNGFAPAGKGGVNNRFTWAS